MMVGEGLDRLISVSVGGDVHFCLKNAGGKHHIHDTGLSPVPNSNALASALWSTLRIQQSPVSQRSH